MSIEAGGKTIAVYDMVNNDMDWFVFGTERLAKLKYTPENGWNFNGQAANTLTTKENGDPFEKPLNNRGAFVFQADFYLYDHLGNSRVTYRAEVKNCKEEVSYTVSYAADYYPYGKILREYKPNDKAERYLTTQHERDLESGLDYRGARFYDSDLGRFLSLDPMAAKYAAWSAYNYVVGNPIRFVDPDGKQGVDYIYLNSKGDEIGRIKDKKVKQVTIIKDENLQKFDNLSEGRQSIAAASEMGTTYDMKSILKVWNKSSNDITTQKTQYIGGKNDGKNRYDIKNEWGASLVLGKDNVVHASTPIQGYPDNAPYGDIPNNKVGTVHTHPNEGKGDTKITGPGGGTIETFFDTNGPSSRDSGYGINTPASGYHSIIIDPQNVHFVSPSSTFKIDLKKIK